MDTKTVIIPKGRFFVKNGKKIEDKYILKYNLYQLRRKWNIWKLIIENKKDERFYKIKNRSYKEHKPSDTVTMKLTHVQIYTLAELKERRKDEVIKAAENEYLAAKNQNDADAFFGRQATYDLSVIKERHDKAISDIDALTDYQKVVDYKNTGV
jgi:hypothetical protein